MTAEIQKYTALPVERMADISAIGEAIAASGMFGAKNAASGLIIAATCHQQGMTLLDFQRTFHIIDGRPSMKADAMLAKFRMAGGRYRIIENSVKRAAAEFEFEGQTVPFEYSVDDAVRTGDCYKADKKTLKPTWDARTDDMLWARMVSRAVRRLCPEIVAGLYTPEEVADFPRPVESAEITQDDVARRVESAKRVHAVVVDSAECSEDLSEVDYTVCPVGDETICGVAWTEFASGILSEALKCDDERITECHRAEIKKVLDSRNA